MKTPWVLTLLLLPAAGFTAFGAVEFNGLLVTNDATQVSLTDTVTGAFSWVPVGGTFNGFTVVKYDATRDELTLKKGTLNQTVKLKDSVILVQATPPPGQNGGGPNGANGSVVGNLRQINNAAQQYFQETGQSSATMADLAKYLPPGTITAASGENYSSLVVNQGQPISVTTATGTTTTFAGGARRVLTDPTTGATTVVGGGTTVMSGTAAGGTPGAAPVNTGTTTYTPRGVTVTGPAASAPVPAPAPAPAN